MKNTPILIHGSIFLLLKKFIESNYDHETWLTVNKLQGAGQPLYEIHKNYPATELLSIVTEAAAITGLTENKLKEAFGESLVPDLLKLYRKYVDPSWKTFDMLMHTEQVMHSAVRTEFSAASPPVLNVAKVSDNVLIIDYHSRRRLGSLAIGIIRGIATHYGEREKVKIIPKTNPNDERVQIRIEFEENKVHDGK